MDFLQQSNAIRLNIIRRTDPRIDFVLGTLSGMPVHPIFQHNRWPQITPGQWVRIQPALVMASFFITCPLAEEFWHGMMFGPTLMDRSRFGPPIKRFDLVYNPSIGNPVPPTELQRVHQILIEVSQATTLSFQDLSHDNIWGFTETYFLHLFHNGRRRCRCRIAVETDYLTFAEKAPPRELLGI